MKEQDVPVVETSLGPVRLQRDPGLPAIPELPYKLPADRMKRLKRAVIKVLSEHVVEQAELRVKAGPKASRAAHG